ncbi:MAG TPA: hypothetical protein PK156_37560 [Polyangium sp.]|nr:hypothetical protein [Polyangium sp.]
MTHKQPLASPLIAPITANSVDWPIVTYGNLTAVNFPLDDSEEPNPGWGRITFEKFDALRVCRGEYMPYEIRRAEEGEENPWSWIWTVSDSPWLLERYTYEKKHYGTAYGFGGDVDEMLRDFSHYVFQFHDQFVEVLADGLWFETSPHNLGDSPPRENHPARDLPESTVVEHFTAHGLVCQVRKNPQPMEAIVSAAAYASQKLYQFGALLDGDARPSWTLALRIRHGKPTFGLREFFGRAAQEYDNVPTLTDIRPRIETWLGEVSERRKSLGK